MNVFINGPKTNIRMKIFNYFKSFLDVTLQTGTCMEVGLSGTPYL